jgi:peptidoglycan/xylan/chitin deacetylase (PgdA/CDA1 family)
MAPNGPYQQNLLGSRVVIPRLLELFERYDVAATWATVGFLFASSRKELDQFRPAILPKYDNPALDPYVEPTGSGEQDDPLHFGASLVDQIRQSPGQEVATHTFSHYYCLEPGQTPDAFRADLRSAIAIAAERGIALRSIVFPRNQVNPAYASALLDAGISCYRGSENGWMYRSVPQGQKVAAMRAARLADSYFGLPGRQIVNWSEIPQADGLCNVRGSRFLRPYRSKLGAFEKLRLRRITAEMNMAAENHAVYHLWLHPHNLGVNIEGNLEFFEEILRAFASCRSRFGMRSLSMNSVAELAREHEFTYTGLENEQFMVTTGSTATHRVRA